MSKQGAKHGRAPNEKPIAESKKKSRKSSGEEKQNSPSRVEVPPPAERTSPASQQESVDSGELELPEQFSKPKKVLNFRNHFPPGARSCRPGCDYSEDDDKDSNLIKDQEIELVMQRNATYYEQMRDDDGPGEDSPFWSNTPLPGLARQSAS